MPTFISHAAVSLPVSLGFTKKKYRKEIILLSVLVSMLPDFDGIGYYFGIPYEHFLGHRGFSHSIVFSAIIAILFTYFCVKQKYIEPKQYKFIFINFFVIGVSHGILDAMTNGGLGIALFSPFNNARFFLPWQPIIVSAILPQYFFQMNGILVFKREILYLILPSIILSLIIYFIKSKQFELKK